MGKYGETARRALKLLGEGKVEFPVEAWRFSAREVFPGRKAAQEKSCPRGAFLGLCEEGLLYGVSRGTYTKSRDNKRYALEAVRLLNEDPAYSSDRAALWKAIMKGETKVENSQLDVVLALWNKGLIRRNQF
jgi:hypothetical protein